jgi:hypothetical protein
MVFAVRECDIALIQVIKEFSKATNRLAEAVERIADVVNPNAAVDFASFKSELLSEVRRVVGENQTPCKPVIEKRWFKIVDVAAELKVKPATIRERCRLGLIVGEKWGKEWKIPASELERVKRDGLPPVPKASESASLEKPVHSVLDLLRE